MNYKNINFKKFGLSKSEILELEKIGIRYDKRTKRNYVLDFEDPLQVEYQEVAEFSAAHGFEMPQDYYDFIININGGYPDKINIIASNGVEKLVNSFFGLKCRDETCTLNYAIRTFGAEMPVKFLPIARMEFGDVLGINLAKLNNGYIYLFDHEIELSSKELENHSNLNFVASSFTDLLTMLH